MQLKDIFTEKVLLVGVGNTLKSDDSAGPVFISKCLSKNIKSEFLDAGVSPENFINKIMNSEFNTLIVVDSVEMGEPPGTIRIFTPEEISNRSISTYNTSLKILFEYIISQKPQIKIYLVGIQPKSLRFGEEISEEVSNSIDKLIEELEFLCMN